MPRGSIQKLLTKSELHDNFNNLTISATQAVAQFRTILAALRQFAEKVSADPLLAGPRASPGPIGRFRFAPVARPAFSGLDCGGLPCGLMNGLARSDHSRHHARGHHTCVSLDRRRFLHDTAAVAAGLAAIPARGDEPREDADAKPVGPNDAIRVAVCGVKSRGMEHVSGWTK